MSTLLFLGGLGGWELFLIMAVILIFFGAKKIPEMARGLGTGIREFKNATKEVQDEINNSATATEDRKPKAEPQVTTPEPQAKQVSENIPANHV